MGVLDPFEYKHCFTMSEDSHPNSRPSSPNEERDNTSNNENNVPVPPVPIDTDINLQLLKHINLLHDLIVAREKRNESQLVRTDVPPQVVVQTPSRDSGDPITAQTNENTLPTSTLQVDMPTAMGSTPGVLYPGMLTYPHQGFVPAGGASCGAWLPIPNVQQGQLATPGIKPCKISDSAYPIFTGQRDAELWRYINEVEHLRNTKLVPESMLLAMLCMRSKDDGLIWFDTDGRFCRNWEALREGLLRAYGSPNHAIAAENELRERTQRPEESWGAFCRDVWHQFKTILPHVPEEQVVQILVRNGRPTVTQRFNDIHVFSTVAELITAGNLAEERNRNDERYRRLQRPPSFTQAGASNSSNEKRDTRPANTPAVPPRRDTRAPWYRKNDTQGQATKCSVCGDDPNKCRGVCGRCKQHGHRKDVCPVPPPNKSTTESSNNPSTLN
jgi:hypothetical protein